MKKRLATFILLVIALLVLLIPAGMADTCSHYYQWVTITASNCSKTGLRQYKCLKCGLVQKSETIAKTSHKLSSWTVTRTATCTQAGLQTRKCSKCSYTETQTISKKAHTYGGWSTTKASTCSVKGQQVRTCSVCGDKQTQALALDSNAHTFSNWTVTKAATCAAAGTKVRTCSGCKKQESATIAKTTTHSYSAWSTTKASTCSVKGQQVRTCSVCGDKQTQALALNANAHTFGSWTVTKTATCAAEGTKARTCSGCKKQETASIAKTTSHSYGNWATTMYATCFRPGVQRHVCTVCGAEETATIPILTHEYVWTTTKNATCTSAGTKEYSCKHCGLVSETQTIGKLGHSMGSWSTTAATCTKDGQKTRKCTRSGCSYKETETLTKTGHSGAWTYASIANHKRTCTVCGTTETAGHQLSGDGVIIQYGDCNKPTIRRYTCSVCGTFTKEDPYGHQYGSWTSAGTANHKRTCSVCGKTETAGHQLSGDGVIIQYGDCNKPTIRRYTCSVCGTFTKEDPYGHQYGSWSSAGTKNHKRTCSVCGKTETAGHQLSGDPVIIQYGDCNKPTIWRYTCSVCGTFTMEDPYGHQFGSWTYSGTEKHKRTCSVCGKTETAGHQLSGDGVILQFGDCDKPTIRQYTCSVCGTFTKEDPYGHDYGDWSYAGTENHKRTCSVCGKAETKGHQITGNGLIVQYGDCNKPTIRQYTCSVCGTFTKEDPYGHDYSDWSYAGTENHKRTCSVCGKTETKGHQITGNGVIVQYGDCNKPTIRQYTCSVCGTFTKEDPYGHDYGDWSYAGTESHKRTCSVCGKTETAGHQLSGDGVIVQYGDCNKPTIRQYTCSVCGTFTKEDPYGHDYGDWSYAGTENHKRTCSVCGKTETESHQISGDDVILVHGDCNKPTIRQYTCSVCGTFTKEDPYGHDYGDWSYAGTENHKRTCSVCGKTETESHQISGDGVILVHGDCNKPTIRQYTCSVCGTFTKEDPYGHNYGDWSYAGTENHTRICSVCGKTETESHQVSGDGVILVHGDCNKPTIRQYTCTVCGTFTKEDPYGHDYGDWSYAGTENHSRTCSVCGATETEGHQVSGDGMILEHGNCNRPTIRQYTCAVCGTFTKEDPYGHEYGDWSYADSDNHVHTCSVCGATETEGHQVTGDGVILVYGDCNKPTIRRYTCAVCGTFTKEDPYGHEYGDWTSAGSESHAHTCAVCGATETEPHEIVGNGLTLEYGNCNRPTIKQYTCAVCGTFTKEEPYGHEYGPWMEADDGWVSICSKCGLAVQMVLEENDEDPPVNPNDESISADAALGAGIVDLGQGWYYRIDQSSSNGHVQRHIHVWKKGGDSYAQNEDGSAHDGLAGDPPKWVTEKIKKLKKWTWKRDNEPEATPGPNNQSTPGPTPNPTPAPGAEPWPAPDPDESGNTSSNMDVGGAFVTVGTGVVVYVLVKIVLAYPTGGLSLVLP